MWTWFAGAFNGAAWRRQIGNGNLSIIEEAFAGSDKPMPPDPPPLWSPFAVPGERADVCGFSQASRLLWKIQGLLKKGNHCLLINNVSLLEFSLQCVRARGAGTLVIWSTGCCCTRSTPEGKKTDDLSGFGFKGASNGFSSRKDLLLTIPARKEAKQARTKATVRFRPERQATVRYRHNIVHTCSTAPMSTIEGAHDRGSPRPGTCVRLSCRECVPILCIASCFVHSTTHCAHGSCLPKKRKNIKSGLTENAAAVCRREYGTAEEDLNECLVRMV